MTDNQDLKFNIRVYGLFINERDEILLCDEHRMGMHMTKFPGGGLKFGEGILACLHREILEESGEEIEIISHFYTTDFFQKAWFFDNQQLISIYYKAVFCEGANFLPNQGEFLSFHEKVENIHFQYMPIAKLKRTDLSFPIDQHVLKMLQDELL